MSPLLLFLAATASQTPTHAEQIRCVAALAIVASEQERGASGEYPPLADDGARFAGIVGERVMAETQRTKEAVRDDILAAVGALQKEAQAGGAPAPLPAALINGCVTMMRTIAPPPPAPTLPVCAGLATLAYDEVHRREGMSKSAKDLATIMTVLNHRAREELRAAGSSEAESDRALALTREDLAAGNAPQPELAACFELAAP